MDPTEPMIRHANAYRHALVRMRLAWGKLLNAFDAGNQEDCGAAVKEIERLTEELDARMEAFQFHKNRHDRRT